MSSPGAGGTPARDARMTVAQASAVDERHWDESVEAALRSSSHLSEPFLTWDGDSVAAKDPEGTMYSVLAPVLPRHDVSGPRISCIQRGCRCSKCSCQCVWVTAVELSLNLWVFLRLLAISCCFSARGRVALAMLQVSQATMVVGGGLVFARAWPALWWLLAIPALDLSYAFPSVPSTAWAGILCVLAVLVALAMLLSECLVSRPVTSEDRRELAEAGEALAVRHAQQWAGLLGAFRWPRWAVRIGTCCGSCSAAAVCGCSASEEAAEEEKGEVGIDAERLRAARRTLQVFGPRGAAWAERLSRLVQLALVLYVPVVRSVVMVLACVPQVAWAVASTSTVLTQRAESQGLIVVTDQATADRMVETILASRVGGSSDPTVLSRARANAYASIAVVPPATFPPAPDEAPGLALCVEQFPTLGLSMSIPFTRRWACPCSGSASFAGPSALAYAALFLFLIPFPLYLWMTLSSAVPPIRPPEAWEAEAAIDRRVKDHNRLVQFKRRLTSKKTASQRPRRASLTQSLSMATRALTTESLAAGRAVVGGATPLTRDGHELEDLQVQPDSPPVVSQGPAVPDHGEKASGDEAIGEPMVPFAVAMEAPSSVGDGAIDPGYDVDEMDEAMLRVDLTNKDDRVARRSARRSAPSALFFPDSPELWRGAEEPSGLWVARGGRPAASRGNDFASPHGLSVDAHVATLPLALQEIVTSRQRGLVVRLVRRGTGQLVRLPSLAVTWPAGNTEQFEATAGPITEWSDPSSTMLAALDLGAHAGTSSCVPRGGAREEFLAEVAGQCASLRIQATDTLRTTTTGVAASTKRRASIVELARAIESGGASDAMWPIESRAAAHAPRPRRRSVLANVLALLHDEPVVKLASEPVRKPKRARRRDSVELLGAAPRASSVAVVSRATTPFQSGTDGRLRPPLVPGTGTLRHTGLTKPRLFAPNSLAAPRPLVDYYQVRYPKPVTIVPPPPPSASSATRSLSAAEPISAEPCPSPATLPTEPPPSEPEKLPPLLTKVPPPRRPARRCCCCGEGSAWVAARGRLGTLIEQEAWIATRVQRKFTRELAIDLLVQASPVGAISRLFQVQHQSFLPATLVLVLVTLIVHGFLWQLPSTQQWVVASLAISAALWHWNLPRTSALLSVVCCPARTKASAARSCWGCCNSAPMKRTLAGQVGSAWSALCLVVAMVVVSVGRCARWRSRKVTDAANSARQDLDAPALAARWAVWGFLPVFSSRGDGLVFQLWLTASAALATLGALSAPGDTKLQLTDTDRVVLVTLGDTFAVALTAIVWSALGLSALGAIVQLRPQLQQPAELAWGVLRWSTTPFGDMTPEPDDIDAFLDAEEDVLPLARTLVRFSAGAAAEEASVESIALENIKRADTIPQSLVDATVRDLVAQRQFLLSGVVRDPTAAPGLMSLAQVLQGSTKGGWNVSAEVTGRVWMGFWDSLLSRGCGPEVAARWEAIQSNAGAHPLSRTLQHVHAPEPVLTLRKWVEAQLEGPDAYWDGPMEDGSEPSNTRFGSLTIIPFPWHCLLAFDDCDTAVELWDEDLPALVARNADPAIAARRSLRRQLRALDGHSVTFPVDRTEPHEINDGMEEYRDPRSGALKTKPRVTTLDLKIRYRSGILRVRRKNDDELFSRGFGVSIEYRDGRGVGEGPHSGVLVELSGLYLELQAEEAGITPNFDMTEPLRHILWNEGAQAALARQVPVVEGAIQAERSRRRLARRRDLAVFDPAFLVEVFAGMGPDVESPETVREWFRRWRGRCGVKPSSTEDVRVSLAEEPSGAAMWIPEEHEAALVFVFRRLEALSRSGPLAALWYLVFSDCWRCNQHVPRIARNADLLDERLPHALCYRPMPRGELESVLQKRGLLQTTRFFTPALLDELYEAISEAHAAHLVTSEL
jgi:hypothetical protein